MTATKTADHASRVWKGDSSTVPEALQAYYLDNEILPLTTVLYSMRRKREVAKKLLSYGPQLLAKARTYLDSLPERSEYARLADEGDVLSTHLEWLSRRVELSPDVRDSYRSSARLVANRGISYAPWTQDYSGNHTRFLLELTHIRSGIRASGATYSNRLALDKLEANVKKYVIRDPKQRVRVLAKLGFLYRLTGNAQGVMWGIRALLVWGVPLNVRLKALAAFFVTD